MTEQKSFARIKFLDATRGWAMVFLIIFHTGLHLWTGAAGEQGTAEPADFLMSFLTFFVSIGGIYSAVLGAVNAFMFYKRVDSGVNKPRQLVFSGLIACFTLISLNFLFRFFVSADSGIFYWALRWGVRVRDLNIPDLFTYTITHPLIDKVIPNYWFISSSSLTILGINSYLVPQILSIASSRFIKKGKRNWRAVYITLFIVGTVILLLSIPIRLYLAPIVENMLREGKTWLAALSWPLALLVYDNFPIFPISAFACYGAILGLALAQKDRVAPKRIYAYTLSMFVVFFGVGLTMIIIRGGLYPGLVYDTIPYALWADFWRHIGQLGICFGFFSLGLALFDFAKPKWQRINTRNSRLFTRLGYLSMTIYIFEGLTAVALGKLIDLIFGTAWRDGMFIVIGIGAILGFLWVLLCWGWEKIQFTGSLEWMVISLNKVMSGKKSQKYTKDRKEVELFQETEKE